MKKNPIISYFRESKEELEKTSWPTQKETIRYTIATIVVTVLCAVFFALLDAALGLGLLELINLTGATNTVPNIDINPVVESIETDDGTIEVIEGEEGSDSTDEDAEATDESSEEETNEDNE